MYKTQFEMIRTIHEVRGPLLDSFFRFLNYFDRQEFFFVLIPIIWLWCGWKWGLRLFYILTLSMFTNITLKQLFALPRPFHLDPSVGVIQVGGYGFPSGTGQTVILLSLILVTHWKSSWKWVVAALYISLISFSRIYLGVHFFTDILGGWVVGFFLWILFAYGFPPIEKKLSRLQPLALFALSQIVPLLALFWVHAKPAANMCSVAMGLAITVSSIYAYKIFLDNPKSYKEYVFRAVAGVGAVFFFYGSTFLIPMENMGSFRFFVTAFGSSLTSQWLSFHKNNA